MRKCKKVIPKDFGTSLSMLINCITKNKYEKEVSNIMAEMAERNDLLEMLASKDEMEKKTCDKVLGFVCSAMNVGLMVGYMLGQWYPFDHSGITKDLNYLSARIPTLKREDDVFFRRNAFLKKLGDIADAKTVITITEHEIEKAATAIVLCWPKNQEDIKCFAEKLRKGIPAGMLIDGKKQPAANGLKTVATWKITPEKIERVGEEGKEVG